MIKPLLSMKNISFILLLFLGGVIINPSLHAQGYISGSRSFGATGADAVSAIIADNGYSYVLHSGPGVNFPTTIGAAPTGTGNKGKLMKLDPDGNIVWSRYLPVSSTGIGATTFSKMILDNGVLHLLGTTTATNVPVTDGSSAGGGGSDILYAQVDPASGNILYTGYHGGSGAESTGLAMAVENGDVYITYTTQSSNIAVTSGPAYTSGFDHVIIKLDGSGNIEYSTYTGSASATATNTEMVSLAVDNGNAWLTMVVGPTNNFTTTDGTTFNGGYDFGIVRLDASGNSLFSTLYGGTADEDAPVAVVKNEELYLTGYSTSSNYPVTDGSSATSQAKEHIITKFNSSNTRTYSGYLAGVGASSDVPEMHEESGAVYLLASTHGSSPSIATTDGTEGGSYLIKLNAANGTVQFATAFGGIRYFANKFGTTLIVGNGYIYTATPVLNATTSAYTTDGSSKKGNQGVFLTRHSTDGQLQFASWLISANSLGIGSFSMDVSNDKIYLGGDFSGTNYPVTMPAIGTLNGTDDIWVSIALCPSFPTDNTILPLTQTICKEGIPQTLTGNKVAFTSDNMPTLYRNGIPEQQNEIRARYQWQVADNPGGPWTNIAATGTQQDFTPHAGSVDKYYRRLVLAPPGCTPELISTSGVAAVLVSVDNSPTVTGAIFNTCAGTPVNINVVATGGTAPYNYTWDNGIISTTDAAMVTPTANSVYTVTVTDANGCQQIGQAIVNAYAADAGPLTASVCAGQPVLIGTAPPAGLAGVNYAWTQPGFLDNPVIAQPLASPTDTTIFEVSMTIPVTGGGTCVTTDNIQVIAVTAPSPDFAGPDRVICKGGSASLGTTAEAGFAYTWVPGNYLSSTSAATVTFNAGSELPQPNSFTYTLNTSKSGCTFSDQVKVSVIQANAGKDYCGPRTVGIADPAPNVAGKTFLWEVVSGPGTITGATNTAQTTVSASSGGATIYRLTVSLDGVSCMDEVLVPECSAGVGGCPNPEIRIASDYTCPAASFGAVTLSAFPSNLSPTEWTYSWTSSTGAGISSATGTTITLTDNIEKDVTLTVTHVDNPLISCTETIHVNDPSWAIPVFSAPDQKICPGGTINIGLPAIAGYSYLWSKVDPGDEALSNPAVSPSVTQDYIAIVTDDASGCTYRDTVTVAVQPLINDPGPDWMVCSNSMITLGSPALPGYTYSWVPSTASYQAGTDENSAEPKVLIAASQDFTLTVTDTETGCTSDSTIHIIIDESSTLPGLSDTTICPGASVVIGNHALTGATYSWSPTTGLSSTTIAQPTANPAVTTIYTVTATFYDELGSPTCAKTGTVSVTVNAPEITMSDDAVCPSGALYDLSTGVSVTGATSYAWSPAILVTSPNVFSTTVKTNPATPTTFTLTATDANGCAVSASKIVSTTNPPPIAGSSGLVCLGSSITLGDNSNTGALSWLWTVDPDEGLSGTLSSYTDPAPVFTPAVADLGKTFTFTLSQDIGGCINTSSVKMTVRGFSLGDIPVQTVCSNSTTTIGLTPVNGVNYQWTPTTGLSHPAAATTMVNNITETSVYTLTATDATGCVATTEAIVGVNPALAPDISIADVTAPFGGLAPPFNPQVTGSPAPYTYTWTPAATLDNPYIANATATTVSIGTTTYNLNVTDANGCTSSAPANLVVKVMGTLPVQLSSVTAQIRDCGVFINWKVESAESFSNFVVERSGDGIRYEAISTVYYNVNRSAYSYSDAMPGNGNWKYRLKLVDIDGRFIYSSVLTARVNCVEQATISVYPNPVSNIVYIKSSKAISKIMLVSITGQTISQHVPAQTQPGIYSIPVGEKIAQGLYILQVTATDGTVQNSKLIKE